MTENAKLILDIINKSNGHLTAEQIYLKLKEQSLTTVLATVYNNLNSLYRKNLIRKITMEGSPDRYDKTARHDHLVCNKCGKLSDITLKDLTSELQSQIDSKILSYDLKVNYTCPECRESENERSAQHQKDDLRIRR